jgi:hypothetical protein
MENIESTTTEQENVVTIKKKLKTHIQMMTYIT